MSVLFQSPDLQLPWSSSDRENKRFSVIATVFLIVSLLIAVFIDMQPKPELSQKDKEKIPASLAKIMERKKVEKPKPIPPKPVEKKVEKKKEKKQEEKKPEKKKPKPKDDKQKKAREKMEKLKKEQAKALNAMANLMPKVKSSANLSSKGNKAAKANRRQLTGGPATATSGGIAVATAPTSSNLSGDLGGRSISTVDASSLGGTAVDASGDVGRATSKASQGVAGQRSEEQIRRVLDGAKGSLYSIYNRALRKDPTLQGKVTFELTIQPDGSVSKVRVVNTGLKNPSLERRLVSKLKSLNFGADDVAVTKSRYLVDFIPF
jgi:outer membrane biosynthesis protein TonB